MFHSLRWRIGLCVFLAAAVPAILPGQASAANLTVCGAGPPVCQYATVADAVAASVDGDVILVGPGSFAGGFAITNRITLVGSGAGSTTIAGGDIAITVASAADAVIRRLKVTGANATGLVNRGTLTVRRCTITGNGGGVQASAGGIQNSGTLTLKEVTVSDNQGWDGGGLVSDGSAVISGSTFADNSGVFDAGALNNSGDLTFRGGTISNNGSQLAGSVNSGSMTIVDSLVKGNSGGNNHGGLANSGSLVVRGTTFTANDGWQGGALANLETGVATLRDSLVSANDARDGGGILSAGSLTLVSTDVVTNTAERGGGIKMVGGSLVVRDSSIADNMATDDSAYGGGLDIEQGDALIARTTVESNSAANGGGIANRPLGNLTLRFDIVTLNTALTGGGVLNEGALTEVGSTIANNTGGDCVGC